MAPRPALTEQTLAANLAAMAALLLIACLSLALMALAVRRALPIAAACIAFWAAQAFVHDLLTAFLAGVAAFALYSVLFDRAAMSVHPIMRFSFRAIECFAGVAVAVFFAWSFARSFGGTAAMTGPPIMMISAALLGGLITTSRYRVG